MLANDPYAPGHDWGVDQLTAEVAILNRGAVALAADSATTVTYWEGGKEQTRYFKGANKIFNISSKFPVGLMIYGGAALQGMPWEVIAKAYRERRGAAPQDQLSGYAHDFFDFISTEGHLFPHEYQEQQLWVNAADAFLRICYVAVRNLEPNKLTASSPDGKANVRQQFEKFSELVRNDKFIDGIDQDFIDKHTAPYFEQVLKSVANARPLLDLEGALEPKEIFNLAVTALFKASYSTLGNTGMVFAGFGQGEFFPKLLHYRCRGVLLLRLLCEHISDDDVSISHENVSDIKNFAQSEMVKTFIYGASIPALQHIDTTFEGALGDFCKSLVEHGHVKPEVDLAKLREVAKSAFNEGTSSHLLSVHSQPLRDVIGMLAIEELAELAETLISIESLKERVTRPSQSVSGPVDVAVISKSDGFIWIKRKHYFDPKLNPRFFSRQN